jgi:acetylornithine/N-succinyldiaminopimelate aminotransferase
LIWAIEFSGPIAEDVVNKCLAEGLLVNNVKPTALRLIPPLTVTEAEIDKALEIIERVLDGIEANPPK